MNTDREKVTVICSVCGTDVKILCNTLKTKDKNIPWRCRRCNDDYRNAIYQSKPQEEKDIFVNKQANRTKQYWANLNDEDKKADSDRRKSVWDKRLKEGDYRIIEAMVDGRAKWYDNLTNEQKEYYYQLRNIGRDKWWNTLSEEEKLTHMQHPHEGFKVWYSNLSGEEQLEFMKPVCEGCQKFWNSLTPEGYQEWCVKHSIGYNKYLHQPKTYPNKNELQLTNMLDLNGIAFELQYHSVVKHPDFDSLFPLNIVTGSKLVDPTHSWDLKINLHDKNILIDVDGSIHTIPPNKFITDGIDVGAYVKFNDSKRPYQTDGYDAYIVLCYDDNLTGDTPVISFQTWEIMTVKQLIELLNFMNLSKKKKRKIMKNL